jgi:periplasmic divalent cation tolerance protein
MDPKELRVVLMTAPDAEVAERVVRELVEERIIACGNIVPGITSIYRWEGAVQRGEEVLVIMKARAAEAPRLLERVSMLHPYNVPEVLLLPISAGHAPYLRWVAESTDLTTGEDVSR